MRTDLSPFAGASVDGVLATLAFLVVFRVLIKLFFWIDITFFSPSLNFCRWNFPPRTAEQRAGGMPNPGSGASKGRSAEKKAVSTNVPIETSATEVNYSSPG
jgi:hypothetical protein